MADISGYLQNIRNGARGEDVRDSIINALDKINKDNPSIVRPLNVTANGTYAGEGGVVYNPVTVNVPEGASQSLSLTDINITENGEFDPDDGQAYRKITVEVPQYVNEIMTDPKVIYLEEGAKDYYALDDGYDGYAQVSVVSGGGGGGGGATYTVNFMAADHTTLLEAVTGVPFGGGAVYHHAEPTASGMRFVGWTPNPLNVRSNMTCFPRFENITYDDTQITDDWITIAKNFQTNPDAYNIGQWKLLELNGWTTMYGGEAPRTIKMKLVAKGVDVLEGENGYAASTWLMPLDFNLPVMAPATGGCETGADGSRGWLYSNLRSMLQNNFTTQAFPQDLLPYIKRVVKTSTVVKHIGTASEMYVSDYPTVEWFWIPSEREVCGGCTDYDTKAASLGGEFTGPVYSSEFGSGDTVNALQSHRRGSYHWLTRTMSKQGSNLGNTWGVENNGWTLDNTFNPMGSAYTRLGFCL